MLREQAAQVEPREASTRDEGGIGDKGRLTQHDTEQQPDGTQRDVYAQVCCVDGGIGLQGRHERSRLVQAQGQSHIVARH